MEWVWSKYRPGKEQVQAVYRASTEQVQLSYWKQNIPVRVIFLKSKPKILAFKELFVSLCVVGRSDTRRTGRCRLPMRSHARVLLTI